MPDDFVRPPIFRDSKALCIAALAFALAGLFTPGAYWSLAFYDVETRETIPTFMLLGLMSYVVVFAFAAAIAARMIEGLNPYKTWFDIAGVACYGLSLLVYGLTLIETAPSSIDGRADMRWSDQAGLYPALGIAVYLFSVVPLLAAMKADDPIPPSGETD